MLDPANPRHLVVRATYGVLSTHDGGESWAWICEGAVGYGGTEDPSLGVTADGSLIAGMFAGLSTSHDGGCSWEPSAADLAHHNVVDVAVDRQAPSSAALLISDSLSADTYFTRVFRSMDDAQTWSAFAAPLPATFWGLTLDSAPGSPQRLYVSGLDGGTPVYRGVLQRSSDGGDSWETLPIAGSDLNHMPYIGAIDPEDPEVVYARLDGATSDTLVVTRDGGRTWQQVLSASSLLGLALSPDGKSLAVGSERDGVLVAATDVLDFEQVSSLGVQCLTWSEDGLYACADQDTSGFTVGVSRDNGRSFEPVLRLEALCGPLACDPKTSTAQICPSAWPAVRSLLGPAACVTGGSDSGPDLGGSASNGGTAGGGVNPSAGGEHSVTDGASTGCGCRIGNSDRLGVGWSAFGAGLFLARLRRRGQGRR